MQGIVDLVRVKVRDARALCDHAPDTTAKQKGPHWLLEADRILEETQELINRSIVISQQAFFMAKVL